MNIFIKDDLHPENEAMLQALYSRSATSVTEHLEKLASTGSGKFMEKFYVGYGHKSIGDCGTTTLFIEGVSLLAAKAIQDFRLYSGQESSTRYIDMAKQAIVDPVGTAESKAVLDRWMRFYTGRQDAVKAHVAERYPMRTGENPTDYARAVAARTFDILRGFLPAGVTTNLSWHVNLRQASDQLDRLRLHPLAEIRLLAADIWAALTGKYTHSFKPEPLTKDDREVYRALCAQRNYFTPSRRRFPKQGEIVASTNIDRDSLAEMDAALVQERPRGMELPPWMTELGTCTFQFLLDFGSFRDIQRNRGGICRMPLVTGQFGFHSWYIEQLPLSLKDEAEALIGEQADDIAALVPGAPRETQDGSALMQYYRPLGQLIPCQVTYGLPALAYVCEQRGGKMIHPTLRKVAHQMADWTESTLKVKLHVDYDPNDFDVRRGTQTITEHS